MGIFDFFKKKKEPDYDPSNIKITDLQKGFVLEYDLKTWVVSESYEYDWGDHFFTREYKLDSGDESIYLHVEYDDELYLSVTKKIKLLMIDEDLPDYIVEHQHPPKKITYKGTTFYFDEESPGYFRNMSSSAENWSELISWDYYDETDKHILNIEQWGDREFDAAVGNVVQEFEFSNILPGENQNQN
ncbi:MAG: DUF4178 domain-containing protein [Candidatus Cyclobacteriaceae bacterium M3_2C_046]